MRVAGARDFDSFGEIKIAETPTDFNKGIKKLIFLINETAAGEKIEAIAGGIAGLSASRQALYLPAQI